MTFKRKSKSKSPNPTVSKLESISMTYRSKRSLAHSTHIGKERLPTFNVSTTMPVERKKRKRNDKHVSLQLPESVGSPPEAKKAKMQKKVSPKKAATTSKQRKTKTTVTDKAPRKQKSPPTGRLSTPIGSLAPPPPIKATPTASQTTPPTATPSRLPKNVDYLTKGHGGVTTIGPNLIPGNRINFGTNRFPYNCTTYSPKTWELLICDYSNGRIVAVKTDGTNPRIFYTIIYPADITISEDGAFVFILTTVNFSADIVKVRLSTMRAVKRMEVGFCRFITCHNQHIAALSFREKRMFLFNLDLEEIRSFPLDEMTHPRACTADKYGNLYITDDSNGAVHVYSWNGNWIREFGRYQYEQVSYGLCVDGDGFVCVSRYYAHCIDVYDNDGELVVAIGVGRKYPGEIRYPAGLCSLDDGRLVVVGNCNSSLQIL